MKSKEEILNKYYTRAADGAPEITADGLLNAMEEYRLHAEEAAFNAARVYQNEITGSGHKFKTFEDYKASLIAVDPTPAEPNEAHTIQFIADSILEQFIPNDAGQKTLSFDIRTNGSDYAVHYEKSTQGYWSFTGYNLIAD